MVTNVSKKRKFVADGVFYAELNEVSRCRTHAFHRLTPSAALHRVPALHRLYAPPFNISVAKYTSQTKYQKLKLCPAPLPCLLCARVLWYVLPQLLTQELAEEGYAGVEVRVTPLRTEIIISATRPQNVLGEKGQRIRELTSVVQKRYVFLPCVVPIGFFLSRSPTLQSASVTLAVIIEVSTHAFHSVPL